MRRAIIGGTGVYGVEGQNRQETVVTEYGAVTVDIQCYKGQEIVFLARHGKAHSVPPHLINYRANMMALKQLDVTHVYATCAVGSCNKEFTPGDIVVMRDFMDFTKSRAHTFYEGADGVKHTDMSEPYCHNLVERFYKESIRHNLKIRGNAVYVCTEGPRFETAAEIDFYHRNKGDVVGMTNVPEVVLAKELGMCYSAIGIVTNWCTGFANDEEIGYEEIMGALVENKKSITGCALDILSDPTLNQDLCRCNRAVMCL
ncbi:S-methyl-5'-thioinosine phosphorylase [Clostridia bacterium]|nr:S-methyl-5'-thioinosine phosphorylase [Clostridia bacterium]